MKHRVLSRSSEQGVQDKFTSSFSYSTLLVKSDVLLWLPLSEPLASTGGDMSMRSSASLQTVVLVPAMAAGAMHSAWKSPVPLVLRGNCLVRWMHIQREIIPSSLLVAVLNALSTQCHSAWQYKSGCPLGKDDMLVTGKVNAESALQRRSPACLKMPLSLFLYVTLSYLSCFGYGINCSCSPALHCILNILF